MGKRGFVAIIITELILIFVSGAVTGAGVYTWQENRINSIEEEKNIIIDDLETQVDEQAQQIAELTTEISKPVQVGLIPGFEIFFPDGEKSSLLNSDIDQVKKALGIADNYLKNENKEVWVYNLPANFGYSGDSLILYFVDKKLVSSRYDNYDGANTLCGQDPCEICAFQKQGSWIYKINQNELYGFELVFPDNWQDQVILIEKKMPVTVTDKIMYSYHVSTIAPNTQEKVFLKSYNIYDRNVYDNIEEPIPATKIVSQDESYVIVEGTRLDWNPEWGLPEDLSFNFIKT